MRPRVLALAAVWLLLASCTAAPRPTASDIPPELTIEEHLLTQSPQAEYGQLFFAEGTQDEILAKHADERTRFLGSGSPACTVADHMAHCTRLGEAELSAWTEYSQGPFSTGKAVVARNGKPIYSIGVGDSSPVESLRGFGVVGDQWILETARVQTHQHGNEIDSEPVGQITIDGRLLNKQYGYQEAFGYQTMQGKPFYFFKRVDRIDISYNGMEIATGYDEIPHYGCCSAGTLNPNPAQNMVSFFARKGEAWYYVEIGVFGTPATATFTPRPTFTMIPSLTRPPSPTPLPTQNSAGLVIVTRLVGHAPTLDPLNFGTAQGEVYSRGLMGLGDTFPPNWTEDYTGISVEMGEHTLLARETDGIDLKHGWVTLNRDGMEIYKIETGGVNPSGNLKSLWAYGDHWALEVEGKVIEDGVLLNQKYSYEEAFGLQTIHGRPFYFFKRNGRIDANYDGQDIALGYDEVPHYGCCSGAELNPVPRKDMAAFFGIQGETWYFVQIGIPAVFDMVSY